MTPESGTTGSATAPSISCTRIWPIVVFTLLYIGVATPLSIARGKIEFLLYIWVLLLFLGLLYVIHRRVGLSCGVL